MFFGCCRRVQIAISGLSRVLCMQEERQLRRRHKSMTSGNHVSRGRMKIRSPALPFSKWEPPPYQPRDSPTDDGDVVRRPNRVIGDHATQTANHYDGGTVAQPAAETGRPAGHSHCPRVSVVDTGGVVIHRSLDGGVRRRTRSTDAATPAKMAGPPATAARRRDRPPHQPPVDPQPATDHPPTSAPPFIVCNYVDPAPVRRDQDPASPSPEVYQHGQLLAPPPSTAAAGTPVAPAGIEIGAAVENEVREVKRMLRSFMAKLSQRDLRERNAFEWRIVALALDRLFFVIYLTIILLALASMFPWREVFALPKLAKTAGAK